MWVDAPNTPSSHRSPKVRAGSFSGAKRVAALVAWSCALLALGCTEPRSDPGLLQFQSEAGSAEPADTSLGVEASEVEQSGDSADGNPSLAPSTPTEAAVAFLAFTDAYRDALCTKVLECKLHTTITYTYATMEGCREFVLDRGLAAIAATAIESGEAIYDHTKVAKCLASVGAFGCNDTVLSLTNLKIATHDACAQVVTGALPAGSSCEVDEQCQGYCDRTKNWRCPGVCAPRFGKGKPCKGWSGCEGGWLCYQGACTDHWVRNAGGPCNYPEECGAGLACLQDQTCGPGAGIGESCGYDALKSDCLRGLACDPATQQCVQRMAIGGPCTFDKQCYGHDLRCVDGVCAAIPLSTTVGGSCKPRSPSKGVLTSFGCKAPLICDVDGICKPPGALGEPCVDHGCQPGAMCDLTDSYLCVPLQCN